MQYRPLGTSGLEVSTLAFGAWQLADPDYWGSDAQADGQAAVDAALDAGITLFDTAEAYGNGESERALGKALGARRDDVLIASKVSETHCAPEGLRAACEASLERLGTDRIDLYQVHWACRDVPFEAAYAELARLEDEGKIRALGVSNFGCEDLGAWMAHGTCVSNQLGYNWAFRAVEHEIAPACLEHGVGIVAYMPLLQGILAGRWKTVEEIPAARRRTRHFAATRPGTRHGEAGCEALLLEALQGLEAVAADLGQSPATIALAWLLAQPGVTSVLVGARNPRQLERNAPATDLVLDPAAIERLDHLSQPMKAHFGPNADLWQSGEDVRIR